MSNVKNKTPTMLFSNKTKRTTSRKHAVSARGEVRVSRIKHPIRARLLDTPAYEISAQNTINQLTRIIEAKNLEIEKLKLKLFTHHDIIEARTKSKEVKRKLMTDMVQGAKLGEILGITRQSVNAQRNQSKLIAVGGKNGNYYPVWQIDKNNNIYEIIPSVIDQIGYQDDWGHVLFFLTSSELLDGKTPLECMRNGEQNTKILDASKVYNQHTAL
jgi:hypothetical protein